MRPIGEIRKMSDEWEYALTIEQWMRHALESGDEESVIKLMKAMPDSLKPRYRKIYFEYRTQKEKK